MKNFKQAILFLSLMLGAAFSAAAVPVTVESVEIPNWQAGGTVCMMKIYASANFTDAAGAMHLGGAVGSANFFQTVTGSVAGTVCTLNSVVLPSTTDAQVNNQVRYTAVLYDAKGTLRAKYLENFAVPATLGGSVTWAQLTVSNQAASRQLPPAYYTAEQTEALIREQVQNVGLTNAAVETKGAVKLSAAPNSAANPVAVGTNDPLILAQAQTAYARSYPSLANAVAAIGPAAKTKLVISTSQTVAASMSIPANITLSFEAGGMISVNAGQTLTVGALQDPGSVQIFTGAGNVILGQNAAPRYNLAWWTGRSDAADATKQIGNLLSSLEVNAGGEALIPVGMWKTTGNLTIPSNATLTGAGNRYSGFKLTANNAAIMKIAAVPGVLVGNITVRGLIFDATGTTGGKGVLMTGAYPWSVQGITFEDVRFKGGDAGLDYNATDATWEIQRLSFNRCIFEFPVNGFKINSVNSDVHFEATQFLVPAGGIALNIIAAGTLSVKDYNAFGGSAVTPGVGQADGSTFLYLDGVVNQLLAEGGQDENLNYFMRTSANVYREGNITLRNNLIQSRIRFTGERTIYSESNLYASGVYTDDNVTAKVFSRGDSLKHYDLGNNPTANPVLANFTASYIASREHLTELVTYQNQFLDVQQPPAFDPVTLAVNPGFSTNYRPKLRVIGNNNGRPLLELADKNGTDIYGYRLTRDAATNVGWLAFEGNQTEPFKGYSFDAAMKIKGASVVTATDIQTLTNKTISGANNMIANIGQGAVTGLTTDLAAKAPLAAPVFTGNAQFAGNVGIGGAAGANRLEIQQTSAAGGTTTANIRNLTSSGYTEYRTTSDGGGAYAASFGVGGTATGDSYQRRGYFYTDTQLDGISYASLKAGATHNFYTGGSAGGNLRFSIGASGAAVTGTLSTTGGINYDRTIIAAGTTGAQTINKANGRVNLAAGATSLVVTNSLVTATSMIIATAQINDAACAVKSAVPAAGSLTINMTAACSGETAVAFWVFN